MGKWSQKVEWTDDTFGNKRSVTFEGKEGQPLEEVRAIAFEYAKKCGWTSPRWWQWWRWGDTRFPEETK